MGDGYKTWTRERLTSAELQGYLQDQAVLQFASAAARDAELVDPDAAGNPIVWLEDIERHLVRSDGAWQTIAPKHWGDFSGNLASLPAGAGLAAGDTVRHTVLNCLLVYNGGLADASRPWRQVDVAIAADRAERLLMTSVAMQTIIHDGFLVHEAAGNRRYAWDGAGIWHPAGGPPQAASTATGNWTNGSNWSVASSSLQEMGGGLAMLTVAVDRTTSTVPIDSKGELANTTMATLIAGAAKWLPVVASGMVSYDGARAAHGYLHPDGRLILTHVAPGGTGPAIAVGEQLQLSGIYRLSDASLHG